MKIGNRLALGCLWVATALLISAQQSEAGVMSRLYLSNSQYVVVVQGTEVIDSWQTNQASGSRDFAIAVDQTVKTLGRSGGQVGHQYTLTGDYLNVDYTNTLKEGRVFDGTTDGTYNYAAQWNSGRIYRFESDWSNPRELFNAGGRERTITYDPTDQTLWIHDWGQGRIEQYMMDGTLLGGFETVDNREGALALDHADGTLWTTVRDEDTLRQYSKSGSLLDEFSVTGLSDLEFGNRDWRGGEFALGGSSFNPIPEPATLAIFSGVLLIASGRRRRG